MIKFTWKKILTCFGMPKTLISDNGLQFAENSFLGWCQERHNELCFTLLAHPHANGKIEMSNRTFMNGIKKRLDNVKGNWLEDLPSVLWSYQMTPRTRKKEAPFSLTYATEAIFPPQLLKRSMRMTRFNKEASEIDLLHNFDLLNEERERERDQLYQAIYKSQTHNYCNK